MLLQHNNVIKEAVNLCYKPNKMISYLKNNYQVLKEHLIFQMILRLANTYEKGDIDNFSFQVTVDIDMKIVIESAKKVAVEELEDLKSWVEKDSPA